MSSYCLKCKKKHTTKKQTESISSIVWKSHNGKTVLLSKCVVCNNKKSRFIKEQEAGGLLSKSEIKTFK